MGSGPTTTTSTSQLTRARPGSTVTDATFDASTTSRSATRVAGGCAHVIDADGTGSRKMPPVRRPLDTLVGDGTRSARPNPSERTSTTPTPLFAPASRSFTSETQYAWPAAVPASVKSMAGLYA